MTDPKAINLLLVEDDEIDVMTVRRAFEKGNIANPLFVAGDGVEALTMLRGARLPAERRLVLLDLNLPRMSGVEFLREIRRDPALQALPVVVLTTSNEERDRVEAFQLNVAGYLLKPVTFSAFVDLMVTINRYWTLVELP
jgi:CheY-like chemotaxis protein